MKENLHGIDKVFLNGIEGHEEMPSEAVWNAIDKNLDKNKVVDINRKYIQLKRIAIALLVMLLGTGLYTWKTASKFAGSNITTKSNVKDIETGTLDNTPIKKKQVNVSPVESLANKSLNGVPTRVAHKNEINQHTANTSLHPVLLQLPGSAVKNQVDNTTSPNTMIESSAKKMASTYPGTDIENVETSNTTLTNKQNNLTANLTALPVISSDIPEARPVIILKQDIKMGSNILPNGIAAANNKNKSGKSKKMPSFTATVFYSPNISSDHTRDNKVFGPPGQPDDNSQNIRKGEQHHSSSGYGILLDYNITKHWAIQSGIAINNKSIRIMPKTIYAKADNNGEVKYLYDCSSGYLFLTPKSSMPPMIGDSIMACESTNMSQYVVIPLSVKYNFSVSRFDLFASAGATINILTKNKIATGFFNGPNTKDETISDKINGLKNNYFGAVASIGATYNLSKRIGISFFPAYNFSLSSVTKDTRIKTYPTALSLAAGIRYNFNASGSR